MEIVRSDFSRVFLIENRANPARTPVYQGYWRAGAVSWDRGTASSIYVPSETQYGKFDVAAQMPGEPGDPEITITARVTTDQSDLLRMARAGCPHDLHLHIGRCRDPRDFNGGWEKVFVLQAAQISRYGTDDLGALEPAQRVVVNEEVPFVGKDYFEINRLNLSKRAQDSNLREVVDIIVADAVNCGICGIPSDGKSHLLALSNPGYGGQPFVLVSTDGGVTWATSSITTASVNATVDDIEVVGQYAVVLSEYENSLFITPLSDLFAGTETWVQVDNGFINLKPARAMFTAGPAFTYAVGVDGYIYKIIDPTAGADSVLREGTFVTPDLNDIHGINALRMVVVGDGGTILHTQSGGRTWQDINDPTGGANLTSVWMRDEDTWLIGTATGELWYTNDSGNTWREKSFPGSGAGVVHDIRFSNSSVGYLAHSTAVPAGRILRTIDGGFSWYVLPEGPATIPTNLRINKLAVAEEVNFVFGGGVESGSGVGATGIIVGGVS